MAKRSYISPLDPIPFEWDGHVVHVSMSSATGMRIQTPPEGVRFRGVPLQAADNYVLDEDGNWQSYMETQTRFRVDVKNLNTGAEGSPAQRRSILSLFRQVAEAFVAAHPKLVARAEIICANNRLVQIEQDVAKAEVALNKALDERYAGIAREAAAKEAAKLAGLDDEAPEADAPAAFAPR